MNNLNVNQEKNRPSRKGNLNPMYGRSHSQQSRQKMSDSHRAYQERIRQAQQQKPMTMDEFLSNNPSVTEYIKVLADKAIKEQIDKIIWKRQNQRFQIPNTWD